MKSSTKQQVSASTTPTDPDLDRYTSYEDDDALVVCDRENPRAWIRSDAHAELQP